ECLIPRDIPGQTFPAPGIFAGKTMIKPECIPGDFCYLTDQRSFDSSIHAFSRMHSEIVIDVTTAQERYQWHNCDCTQELLCNLGVPSCADRADKNRMHFSNVRGFPSSIIQVDLNGAAHNPCVVLTSIIGDIDYEGTFTIDVGERSVEFDGLIDV